ncbi:MAG: hypothetical protein R3F39_15220 [Myxococcota bacterium]
MKLIRLVSALILASVLVATPAFADDIPETFQNDAPGVLPAGLTLKDVTGTGKDEGKVERVVSWNEGDGGHVAVFASTEKEGQRGGETWYSKVLYVTTFHVRDGKFTKVRAVKEAVQPCNLDMTVRFIDGSIGLTNIDGNDKGELTFAYIANCAGDVSPLGMKLLMLEGNAKYALRGGSRVDLGGGVTEGGTFKPDFKKAPRGFLEHATKVWNRHIDGR